MPKATANKLEIARRHLDAGIRLVFEDVDPVPTHTLLFAAGEVLKDLCDAKGLKADIDRGMTELVKPEYQTYFHQAMRKHALFFKHAKSDPDGEIELFDAALNDCLALTAIQRFRALSQELSVSMHVFFAWIMWSHPTWLLDKLPPAYQKIQDLFAGLGRPERLIFGRIYLMVHAGQGDPVKALEDFQAHFPQAYDDAMRAMSELGATMGLPEFVAPRQRR